MESNAGGMRAPVRADDSIRVLELPSRVRRRLQRAGIHTVGDLVVQREGDLLTMAGFGGASLREVKRKLAEHGLRLGGGPPAAPAGAAMTRRLMRDSTGMRIAAGLAANPALVSQFRTPVRGNRVVDDYIDLISDAAGRIAAAMLRREQQAQGPK